MHDNLIAFGVLGVYIIIDIAKHIITLAFKLLLSINPSFENYLNCSRNNDQSCDQSYAGSDLL